MTIRTYTASVGEVYSHVGSDRKFIKALARLCDAFELWENPDGRNYKTDRLREGLPPIVFDKGEMKGDLSAHTLFHSDLVQELFSGDIRSRNSLIDLGTFYKRIKTTPEFPKVVFENILLKMLWISSGRGKIRQAA